MPYVFVLGVVGFGTKGLVLWFGEGGKGVRGIILGGGECSGRDHASSSKTYLPYIKEIYVLIYLDILCVAEVSFRSGCGWWMGG